MVRTAMRWRKQPPVSRTVRERYEYRSLLRSPGPLRWFVMPDDAMRPVLRSGARIAVEMACMPDVGDLFLYREAGRLRVGRCLDIRLDARNQREYGQKADATLDLSWVPEAAVVGTVRYIPHGHRYVDIRHWRWRRLAIQHLGLCRRARRAGSRTPRPLSAWPAALLALRRRLLHWRTVRLLRRSRPVPGALLTEVAGEIHHPPAAPSR